MLATGGRRDPFHQAGGGDTVMILRHLLAILMLPFVVVVIIPRWLLRVYTTSDTHWASATAAASAPWKNA